MKIKLNRWLIGFLFLIMFLSGLASSYIGHYMGKEALKVVTQPDVNSQDSNLNQKPLGGRYKGLKIIKEAEVLKQMNRLFQSK